MCRLFCVYARKPKHQHNEDGIGIERLPYFRKNIYTRKEVL